jgi:hypothetical protein
MRCGFPDRRSPNPSRRKAAGGDLPRRGQNTCAAWGGIIIILEEKKKTGKTPTP